MTKEEIKIKSLEIASRFVSASILGNSLSNGDGANKLIKNLLKNSIPPDSLELPENLLIEYAKKIEVKINNFISTP